MKTIATKTAEGCALITILFEDRTFTGEVELRRDTRGVWDSWGDCPSLWCSDNVWAGIEHAADQDEACSAVIAAAREVLS